MKNIIKTIAILLLISGCSSNGSSNTVKESEEKTEFILKSYTIGSIDDRINFSTEYEYNDQFSLIKITENSDSKEEGWTTSWTRETTYDDRGNELCVESYLRNYMSTEAIQGGASKLSSYYEYDEEKVVREEKTYISDYGDRMVAIDYIYDSEGKEIKSVAYIDGEVVTTENQYDDKGRIINSVSDDGSKEEYMYDANGNIVLHKELYSNGDIHLKQNTYDSMNRLLSYVEEHPLIGKVISNYEYDENGNLKIKTFYANGKCNTISEYEYDSNNNLVKCSSSSPVYNTSYTEEYEYDINNNLITYSYSGWFTAVNEYDENNNIVKSSHYDVDGNLFEWKEYKYIEAKVKEYNPPRSIKVDLKHDLDVTFGEYGK